MQYLRILFLAFKEHIVLESRIFVVLVLLSESLSMKSC